MLALASEAECRGASSIGPALDKSMFDAPNVRHVRPFVVAAILEASSTRSGLRRLQPSCGDVRVPQRRLRGALRGRRPLVSSAGAL